MQSSWKRLYRNKGAVAGLLVIALSVLISVLAYALAPDNTPDANRMILEIEGQHPGFRITMLAVKKERPVVTVSLWERLLHGQEPDMTWIPLRSWQFKDSAIVIQRYVDESTGREEVYPLTTVLYGKPVATVSLAELQEEVRKMRIFNATYWLGTDKFGRDILSRLLVGTRVSLGVGCIAVVISLSIGVLLGAVAGYFKGRTDDVVMWLVNVVWSMPTLLLVFALTLALGKGFWQVFIAVGLTMWVGVARIIRGQVLAIRELEYVEAARALGYGHVRIIVKHILPNILGPVMVVAAGNFATAIVVEAGLSFLGVGVQPPQPSWGLMIKENYNFIITHNPLLALAPGIAIMLLVLAFNLLGNGLRDAMDVRSKI
ncbi:peptide/nickel transport system permease protein [Chitinophaga polysaccharea]|uniref:Peptide/nickel transport system permease protein n=1 Tax=Chitinophaga polysaccharea TaxID=1293035 RepID=A0A561Q1Y0_9BACT|nr:ABC transporter permease [Chitinophaga polysaccharea]TWF44386.1 peptide/nickel transport system permease protein [Chitinophaga polysaccharea]